MPGWSSKACGRQADRWRSSVNRDTKPVLAVVVGVAIIMVAFTALRSGTTETGELRAVTLGDPQDLGPSGTPAAVVVGKNQSGGRSILWMEFGQRNRLSVQFYAPHGCADLIDFGEQWPAPFNECTSSVPVTGAISGLGTAATGESIVAVDVEVTLDCFDEVTTGSFWPPEVATCTTDTP